MKRVVVLGTRARAGVEEAVRRELDWLASKVSVVGVDLDGEMAIAPLRADFAVVFGGDGTILAAARRLAPLGVPAVGVNVGTLGFLAEIAPEGFREAVETILAARAVESRRMMLEAVHTSGRKKATLLALNDVVLSRSGSSPLVRLQMSLGGSEVASFRGDGLIVSTPTGSTAYNLSAGGPILAPAVDGIVVTPVCPHTLSLRPLVVSGSETVEIRPGEGEPPMTLTVDGRPQGAVAQGDVVRVARSEHVFSLLGMPRSNDYGIIRDKLHWGLHAPGER
jgi:NAD+ kinase